MVKSLYWADNYIHRKRSTAKAIEMIRPGQRVYIGFASGEPKELVRGLSEASKWLTGIEIVKLMSLEVTSLTEIANRTKDFNLNIRTIYLGSARLEAIAKNRRFVTPMNISEVPGLFKSRRLPIDVALIQLSPPDDFGWMSLGVSVDVTLAAATSADLVIAQVNPKMPRVMGQGFIHVNDVDVIVEHEEDLPVRVPSELSEVTTAIGSNIARLIEDGSTLQLGLDAASQATLRALHDKNDLGIHSQFLTDDMMHLYSKGVITNRKKGLNEGKIVASCAIGSSSLYEFIHDNPGVDFRPSDYVNDPLIISQHHRMVSVNVAKAIDLTGQVSAEASAQTLFAGVSGIVDFVRGAKRSPGGKSIMILPSTTPDGQTSNIYPMLRNSAVVVPRGDVQYVATEYGSVNLFGKSLQERAMAMISIAHPKFREELLEAAKADGLVGTERTLGEANHGIYPVRFEETMEIRGQRITFRPSKPVDERRIQEHYYALDKNDIMRRFFHEKSSFSRSDVAVRSLTDYIRDMTFVALVGEFGFDRVVAVGEYLRLDRSNMAEVAFSVSKDYQGMGLGRILMRKLAAAARENGISGLIAYTSPQNKAMISLFKTLPYKIKTSFDGDTIELSCRFDQIEVREGRK